MSQSTNDPLVSKEKCSYFTQGYVCQFHLLLRHLFFHSEDQSYYQNYSINPLPKYISSHNSETTLERKTERHTTKQDYSSEDNIKTRKI